VDALSDGEDVVIGGIMQHIEEAGIHSGDSSCVLPTVDIPEPLLQRMRDYTYKLARALRVIGLMNVQFAIPRVELGLAGHGTPATAGGAEPRNHTVNGSGKVYVLEVNPRASRTVPFVSKATGVPMAKIAARLMTGRKLREFLPENIERGTDLDTGRCFFVKSPVFPWSKFPGVDTVLGPEMRSTGEVMGIDTDFPHAFAKSQTAAYGGLPDAGRVFVSVADGDKRAIIFPVKRLVDLGFEVLATQGTAEVLRRNGIRSTVVRKHSAGRGPGDEPTIVERIAAGEVDMVVNTPSGPAARLDGYEIRAATTSMDKPIITTVQQLAAAVQAIEAARNEPVRVTSLQEHALALRAGRAAQALAARGEPGTQPAAALVASTGAAAQPSAASPGRPR